VIEFTVHGEAKPAGSKRAFRNQHTGRIQLVDASGKKGANWRARVAHEAKEAMNGRPLLDGPLVLKAMFVRARPKSHYGTGKNKDVLKPTAPAWPTTRPDTTKLLRAVEDSLSSVIYHDDSQIVTQIATKVYGDPPRVEIIVTELEPDTA